MARYYGPGHESSGGFSMIIALALIVAGALMINMKLRFIPLELDPSNGLFLLIVGVLAVVGGILLLAHRSQRRLY